MASFNLNYKRGFDMSKATNDVEAAIGQITTLPKDIERPIVRQYVNYDPVGNLLLSGDFPEQAYSQERKSDSRAVGTHLDFRLYGDHGSSWSSSFLCGRLDRDRGVGSTIELGPGALHSGAEPVIRP